MASTGSEEYIVFPMAVMNITTKMNVGTHVNSYAIDIAGRDHNIESAFAPFTGIIKKKWENGNSIWLESVAPVLFADGSVDYAVIMMTHDNSIKDLYVGQIIYQGVNFYQEGTAGQASGNHIHLGVGKGKFTGTGWYQNKEGYWVINNQVKPYEAFYLSGTEIINDGGYPWKNIEGVEMTDQEIRDTALYLRLAAGDSLEKANANNDNDFKQIKANPAYLPALAKQVYDGNEVFRWKGTHYDEQVAISYEKGRLEADSSKDSEDLKKIKEGLGLL